MRKTINPKLYWFILLLIPLISEAQKPKSNTFFNYLSNIDPLNIQLELDLDSLEALKRTNTYLPAKMFHKEGKEWDATELQVRARGKFRRTRCVFPPLKLNFSKKELKKAGYKAYDEFKLVTHCLDGKLGKDPILREYLAYKIYQQLTDHSFRVKLVNVTYQDNKDRRIEKNIGILIEPEKELKKRLDLKSCEDCYNAKSETIHAEMGAVHALFQYMIGNSDWSVSRLRNIALMQQEDKETLVPIPYDFDFSGLVNAPYAIPQPEYNLENVRQRLFIGSIQDANNLEEAIRFFQSKKALIMNEVEQIKKLSKKSKKKTLKYLESFFEDIEDSEINLWKSEN